MHRNLILAGSLLVGATLADTAASAQAIQRIRIEGRVVDSAWIILYADFDVKWSDGTVHRLSHPLASGSVGALPSDPFDFADGTRTLADIDAIFLRAEAATGTPYGTVYWDCLGLENVGVAYTLAGSPNSWIRIDINEPEPLVPEPTGERTNCTGLRRARLY